MEQLRQWNLVFGRGHVSLVRFVNWGLRAIDCDMNRKGMENRVFSLWSYRCARLSRDPPLIIARITLATPAELKFSPRCANTKIIFFVQSRTKLLGLDPIITRITPKNVKAFPPPRNRNSKRLHHQQSTIEHHNISILEFLKI